MINSSLENQIKDGKGKFLLVHFEESEDIHVPVNCRTGNEEGIEKGINVAHEREIRNDNLDLRKRKRGKNMERKKSKKCLESTAEGSKRKKHKGTESDDGEKEKKDRGNASSNEEDNRIK